MGDIIPAIMRWLHISSVVTLIGGIIYARLVATPATEALNPEDREKFWERAGAIYRPLIITAMAGLLVSGTYTLMINPGHSGTYHILFGIKMLLVAHVFAVAVLLTRPHNPRRTRMLTGTMISGLTIVFISSWLRLIF
jgi:uncharacterized membrane protein